MPSNVGWMYGPEDIEWDARQGARLMLQYLLDHGDITEEVFLKYIDNVVFCYHKPTWYSALWKKIWPWADKDTYMLNIGMMDLPKPQEEEKKKEEEQNA
jgi:hypothetical protein